MADEVRFSNFRSWQSKKNSFCLLLDGTLKSLWLLKCLKWRNLMIWTSISIFPILFRFWIPQQIQIQIRINSRIKMSEQFLIHFWNLWACYKKQLSSIVKLAKSSSRKSQDMTVCTNTIRDGRLLWHFQLSLMRYLDLFQKRWIFFMRRFSLGFPCILHFLFLDSLHEYGKEMSSIEFKAPLLKMWSG